MPEPTHTQNGNDPFPEYLGPPENQPPGDDTGGWEDPNLNDPPDDNTPPNNTGGTPLKNSPYSWLYIAGLVVLAWLLWKQLK